MKIQVFLFITFFSLLCVQTIANTNIECLSTATFQGNKDMSCEVTPIKNNDKQVLLTYRGEQNTDDSFSLDLSVQYNVDDKKFGIELTCPFLFSSDKLSYIGSLKRMPNKDTGDFIVKRINDKSLLLTISLNYGREKLVTNFYINIKRESGIDHGRKVAKKSLLKKYKDDPTKPLCDFKNDLTNRERHLLLNSRKLYNAPLAKNDIDNLLTFIAKQGKKSKGESVQLEDLQFQATRLLLKQESCDSRLFPILWKKVKLGSDKEWEYYFRLIANKAFSEYEKNGNTDLIQKLFNELKGNIDKHPMLTPCFSKIAIILNDSNLSNLILTKAENNIINDKSGDIPLISNQMLASIFLRSSKSIKYLKILLSFAYLPGKPFSTVERCRQGKVATMAFIILKNAPEASKLLSDMEFCKDIETQRILKITMKWLKKEWSKSYKDRVLSDYSVIYTDYKNSFDRSK